MVTLAYLHELYAEIDRLKREVSRLKHNSVVQELINEIPKFLLEEAS